MRGKIFLLTLVMLIVNYSFCSAVSEGQNNHGTLKSSQLVLGYISVTNTPLEILNAYGQPTKIDGSNGIKWFYGKDFFIQFIGGGNSSIDEITTTGNNGIKTADGVGVGMPENILPQIYGEPTYQKEYDSEKNYWYYGSGNYNFVYLQFTCQNGVIKKISLIHLD